MIYFICYNDFQIMQALIYALQNDKKVIIYLVGLAEENYNNDSFVTFKEVNKQFFNLSLILHYYNFTPNDLELYRVVNDLDKELHVFQDIKSLFAIGRDNVFLHEIGDATYKQNNSNLYGEDDGITVFRHVMQSDKFKSKRHQHWNFTKDLQEDKELRLKALRAFKKVSLPNIIPSKKSILFIHNEPDDKYTYKDKIAINKALSDLFRSITKSGYELWIKAHHKRKSSIRFENYTDKIIANVPLELIPNLEDFTYLISVRNNALENISKLNCINALSREEIMENKNNWKNLYLDGIQILKSSLKLT